MSSKNYEERFDAISKQILEEKKLSLHRFLRRIDAVTSWLLIMLISPILLFVIELVVSIPEIPVVGGLTISEAFKTFYLAAIAIAVTICILFMKYNEHL